MQTYFTASVSEDDDEMAVLGDSTFKVKVADYQQIFQVSRNQAIKDVKEGVFELSRSAVIFTRKKGVLTASRALANRGWQPISSWYLGNRI